jgi:hypothetical protein
MPPLQFRRTDDEWPNPAYLRHPAISSIKPMIAGCSCQLLIAITICRNFIQASAAPRWMTNLPVLVSP